MIEVTEQDSTYNDLEKKSILEILQNINNEDKTVPYTVEKVIPQIVALTNAASDKMNNGGRLFYIGAGTSGRLGVLDASECPPTFGVTHERVIGIMAGGDIAIRKAVENAEDNSSQAWTDLLVYNICEKDVLIGIAASGKTPYVVGGLKKANEMGIITGCIVCNGNSPIAANSKYPIEVIVGPEFLTGSTRMKAGTAQKLVLNMISTTVMIKMGRVKGNKMVDMQLTNNKLVNRAVEMIVKESGIDKQTATKLLNEFGSVRKAVEAYMATLE